MPRPRTRLPHRTVTDRRRGIRWCSAPVPRTRGDDGR
jgi:hypothetical protein